MEKGQNRQVRLKVKHEDIDGIFSAALGQASARKDK